MQCWGFGIETVGARKIQNIFYVPILSSPISYNMASFKSLHVIRGTVSGVGYGAGTGTVFEYFSDLLRVGGED
jgi:hypothetical protein